MSEEFVFWVDDVVRIKPTACTYDKKELSANLKGDNFNWIVTEIDSPNKRLYLGAYKAFNLRYTRQPPIQIRESDAQLVELACRHSSTRIDPAVAPTCTTDGKTEGKRCICSGCDKILVPQQSIPALGHKWECDISRNKQICKVCKVEEPLDLKKIELTADDIVEMIKIVEGMLDNVD